MEAKDFKALRISLASPEQIRSWSYGEVTKPETINYRRLRPEKDGLFCEAIFGPTRDWQCYCGKYKNVRYRGIICEKCGVEITKASVRRERMGHIELAAPVAHVWYVRRVPSYLGILLDISKRNLDRVLYFAQYIITHVDEEARQKALKRLDEEFQKRKEELEQAARETIAAIETRLDQEVSTREARLKEVKARFEEALNQAMDPLMKEAQRIEARINDQQGKPARTALIFGPTGTVIVQKGEVIGREHLVRLQETVQDKLAEVEAEIRTEQEREQARIQREIEQWRAGAADQIERVEIRLAQEIEALQARINQDREELLNLSQKDFLNESQYRALKSKWGQVFKAGMGAEAFYEILSNIDLDKMAEELWREIRTSKSKQRTKKAVKQLRVVEALRKSGNRPEWMILTVLPVIPPDLRPMVQLDGGRFATSDLNDLYRRVINRNNRLKRLLELGAPDVIVRNEKRMLQEAVDSLIDNSQRGRALSRRGRRELKSLSDMLKGKKGRFRRNLLGKRVDYSGRSVIVIGPKLKLHQCGLPKEMALELYRPFVIAELVRRNFASNVKGAKRLIERQRPEVWEVLEEVIKDRPVLLNRAPTLHRLGIQAFEPVLIEGKAIQIHPLVCTAFNADFDGDQMAVHVPLSAKAVEEARKLMLSTKNLLKPADGAPIVGPTKDMVLGVYYLTMETPDGPKTSKVFADMEEVALAYELKVVDLHASIQILTETYYDEEGEPYEDGKPRRRLIETTVGRVLFNQVLPPELRFVNRVLDKGGLQQLVAACYQKLGPEATTEFVDAVKDLGFKFATRSGVTIAISDLTVPEEKQQILEETSAQVARVERQYRRGLLTTEEQYSKTIELWTRARDRVAEAVARVMDPTGSIHVMASSGATKGGFQPISQLAGMRGLMADPSGRIIALPIRSSFREGLSALEYFISTHGARKGLADTALRTADAGYLTRRLVDVAQDVIINAWDCGTQAGIWIRRADSEAMGGQTMYERLIGRMAAAPIANPETGEIIVDRNEMIEEEHAALIEKLGIEEVYVRSPMTCQLEFGICALCYGRDLGRGKMVEIGAAVGIVAAQSIGEPGTQLTLRTFHTGGVAGTSDITHGLPRVEELFEARRQPKGEAIISDIGGTVHILRGADGQRKVLVVDSQIETDEYTVPGNWALRVEDGQEIKAGALIAKRGDEEIHAERGGRVRIKNGRVLVLHETRTEYEYEIPSAARLLVKEGDRIEPGDALIEGSKNPHRILNILGPEATQFYLLSEVQKTYRSQGVHINDKHFEIIIRKMMSKVQIMNSGDTEYLPGDLVDRLKLARENEEIIAQGGRPAKARQVLLGITKAALNTESFLSAASFQHTITVLAGAAIEGATDPLRGLKENVIIGKLIPAGTGYRGEASVGGEPVTSYEGVALGREPTPTPTPEETTEAVPGGLQVLE